MQHVLYRYREALWNTGDSSYEMGGRIWNPMTPDLIMMLRVAGSAVPTGEKRWIVFRYFLPQEERDPHDFRRSTRAPVGYSLGQRGTLHRSRDQIRQDVN